MDIVKTVDPEDYDVGVIVARFQIHELHDAHRELVERVMNNHKTVIIFLGRPVIENTKRNPLDFPTRQIMVQQMYPKAIVHPMPDKRSNEVWSHELDNQIKLIIGDRKPLLYGGRDSFIPYYNGRYQTAELETKVYLSGTEIRKQISRELLESSDFRAGIIYANYARRDVTYPTVDIVPHNGKGQVLLAKKPYEPKWRFIGGFVDPTDESYEHAAVRELHEEAGSNLNVGIAKDMKYILSHKVNDWRYTKEGDGIMTSLYLCSVQWGRPEPNDDISEVRWVDLDDLTDHEKVVRIMMPEHVSMMDDFMTKRGNELLEEFKNKETNLQS